MISQIIRDIALDSPFETGFITFTINLGSRLHQALSLQLIWSGVTGEMDGRIDICASNIVSSDSILQSVTVNSVTNVANSLLIKLEPIYQNLKIKYDPNGITSGLLNAYLYYSEVKP